MMKQKIYNILLTGVGGQGVLLASQILAETALAAGYDVKKAEVHGMAQRGGSVVSHVRFGEEVFSPLISKHEADFLVAFEPLEALRHLAYLRPGGTIIMNNQRILPQSVRIGEAVYPANIDRLCRRVAERVITVEAARVAEELGNRRAANVLVLGLLSTFLPLPDDAWMETIRRRVPARAFQVNREAFEHGRLVVEENAGSSAMLHQQA